MKYKIKFHADIAYPKGRIVGKEGDVILNTDESIEAMRADASLVSTLQTCLTKQMKTGIVFNLTIKDISRVNQI